jgi:hypothetical protein
MMTVEESAAETAVIASTAAASLEGAVRNSCSISERIPSVRTDDAQ